MKSNLVNKLTLDPQFKRLNGLLLSDLKNLNREAQRLLSHTDRKKGGLLKSKVTCA
jgi:hypothetical protein